MQSHKFNLLKFIVFGFYITCSFASGYSLESVYYKSIDNPEYYGFEGWGRTHAITIDAIQVSDNLVNFPMLITLDHLNDEVVDAGSFSALNGGGDIRFSSDSSGNIPLAAEIVSFVTSSNPANRKCQIWVKVPVVSSTANTTIYIWYNKTGETQPASSSTYGSEAVWSDYEAVWHMDASPSGTIFDATGNGYNLSSSGSMGAGNLVAGAIGGAIQFDGIDDQLVISTPLSYNSSFTFSSIFNWSGNNQYNGILANKSPWSGIWVNNGGGGRLVFYDGDAQEFSNSGFFVSNQTSKYDFVAINGDYQHFFGGVADITGTNALTTGSFTHVGSEGNSGYFSGWIDELRVTALSRSQAWLQAEQNNQMNPSNFATKGTSSDVSTGGTGGGSSLWSIDSNNLFYNQGSVGIGIADPGTDKLAVNGNIRDKEVKVETTNWPDYVFKENYELSSLEDIQKHINEKGHLINIPSAEEVEANGIQLGEMNKLLLEKIEELTLYAIDQQKQITKLKKIEVAHYAFQKELESLKYEIIQLKLEQYEK